jgi:alpha,alpha-trehalase
MGLSRARLVCVRAACIVLAVLAAARADAQARPAEQYQELFDRVQRERLFPDSKTFADAEAVRPPETVLAEYRAASSRPDFDLRAFVATRFVMPRSAGEAYHSQPGQDVRQHIDQLWNVLTREADRASPLSSRIPLPHRYVVPGGRFAEIYYWDSYFTMLGLEESGRHDLTVAMLKNFAWEITTLGHVPNGNRSYYSSRSQPPFFALMVQLVVERDGPATYAEYLPALKREYAFWMDGAATLRGVAAHRRVVRLGDGSLLNRYWDDRDTPREEAYREDVATAQASTRPASEVYRNLRAAAESGWDFSSRWFADAKTLGTIRTTELIPPDLNSLLYSLELTIAAGCDAGGDPGGAKHMRERAAARKNAMQRYLWNRELTAFTDYDFRAQKPSPQLTAASLYPLFVKLASKAQARAVAAATRAQLLQPHGLATTTHNTGQQWDAPNGWAPLQWIAIRGLLNYDERALAATIARGWVGANLDVFRSTGKLVEKYDVSGSVGGRGGEYPLQDGFGWTNGVLRKLLALYPELVP